MNSIMSIICKFSKRVTAIFEKNIWNAFIWIEAFLQKLNIANWNFFKIIISDRNRKFLTNFWKNFFERLKIKLLYTTIYHLQTDDIFEKTNQIMKIIFRFHIQILKNSKNWLKIFDALQRKLNNSRNFINKSLNEICYEFTSLKNFDLIKIDIEISFFFSQMTKMQISDAITLTQNLFKHTYNNNHKFLQMKMKDWTLLCLHKDYDVVFTVVLKFKLSSQYAEFFRITEKIDNLIYKFDISINWRVHSIFSIAHLKFAQNFIIDFFQRTIKQSEFIFVNENIENVQFFEIEKLIVSRETRRRNTEYLVKWKNYESKHDVWRNIFELKNAIKLINEFKQNVFTTESIRNRKNRSRKSYVSTKRR